MDLKLLIKFLLILNSVIFGLSEIVGVKEDIKNLADDDVLVISVSHSKRDSANSTTTSTTEKAIIGLTKSVEIEEINKTTTSTPSSTTPTPIIIKKAPL